MRYAVNEWLLAVPPRRALSWPLGLMALIFWLSSVPDDGATDTWTAVVLAWVDPSWQNTIHLPVYGTLALLWCRALNAWRLPAAAIAALALALATGYGILDEWHQAFVPGRYSTP